MNSPLDTLHNPIIQSQDPDTIYYPSFEIVTLVTILEWPWKILMHSPLDTLHNPIV